MVSESSIHQQRSIRTQSNRDAYTGHCTGLKMARFTFVFFFISLFFVFRGGLTTTPPSGHSLGMPWPMPQSFVQSDKVLSVSRDSFFIRVTGEDCDVLESAINRYYKIILYGSVVDTTLRFHGQHRYRSNADSLPYLNITVTSECDLYPSLNMDESYNLTIQAGAGVLAAKSVWGALRGLETLSQIVYQDETEQLLVKEVKISDHPRFSYRGVMLDTSRHFIPKEVLLANLEAMSYNKFNVFHWHIVDSPSFPYESRAFPDLSAKGAFDKRNHVYTQEDIKEIIEFARLRGIRVVSEFDTPGHTASWGKGQPGLLTPCYKDGKPDGTYGPINPILNSTYEFLHTLMTELTQVFPDNYLHLGGDEVSFSCWQSNPDIKAFMQKMGFGDDYSKLESFYEENLLAIVNKLNHEYVVWQEIFDNKLKVRPDTVIHVWKSGGWQDEMKRVTNSSLKAILSSPWYLNYISYGSDWAKYYAINPTDFGGSDTQKGLVMGGEACMWGEYVDGTNLLPRLWPRAGAVAERLWSSEKLTSSSSAGPRMEENRCRLLRRGITAQPPTGPGYCNEPPKYYGPVFN